MTAVRTGQQTSFDHCCPHCPNSAWWNESASVVFRAPFLMAGHRLHRASLASSIADLQHPPELLPDLWLAMESGADLAVASRYALGATTGRWQRLRRAISSFAVFVCRPLQRRNLLVKDPMSGFFMTRRSVVRQLPTLQRSGFKLLLEILICGPIQRVQEIPFCFGMRQGGLSKAGIARTYRLCSAALPSLHLAREKRDLRFASCVRRTEAKRFGTQSPYNVDRPAWSSLA